MSNTQPEALRLADYIQSRTRPLDSGTALMAATELRRLHALNAELLEALKFIKADVCERFDMDSPSTNPGMKLAVKLASAAIAKAEAA